MASNPVKPTRVQHRCNMGYDKMLRYMNELDRRNLITKKRQLMVTERGNKFMSDFEKIKEQLDNLSSVYLVC